MAKDSQNLPKSIDGVRPMPRLSGENQEHHLGETPGSSQAGLPIDQTSLSGQDSRAAETGRKDGFPYAAVVAAVVAGAALICLAVFLQIKTTS